MSRSFGYPRWTKGMEKMRILIYADFRSPHARGWADGVESCGIEVIRVTSEVTTVPGDFEQPNDFLAKFRHRLLARREAKATASPGEESGQSMSAEEVPEGIHAVYALMRLNSRKNQLQRLCREYRPDLIHALRLPYEGVTALTAGLDIPVVVSTWGQDFVPQAASSRLLRIWARLALRKAAGLHFDAPADEFRAEAAGFTPGRETLFAAGNFGVDVTNFYPSGDKRPGHVVFPRGRQSVSNGAGFIEAAKLLADREELTFTAVGLEGVDYAEAARCLPGLRDRLTLTPKLPMDAFAKVIRSADVVVSPATSDGTPISLLSSLASGVPVVAGRIPAMEHLAESVSGLYLVDPHSPDEIAAEVLRVLALENGQPVMPAAFSIAANQKRVPDFYERVLISGDN